MGPEVWLAGSLPGGEHQAGSSFQGWRIDEARKGSARERPEQTGCRDEEGIQTRRASPGGLTLQEAVGKARGSSQE